jgi:gamma-glutamyl hercynylcysteine S-oxide hydrolase
MCRHLAYLGPRVPLGDIVLHQPHSLLRQSWAPMDMRGGGTINADGFGLGWLADDRTDDPADQGVARRYRRDIPIWSDASLPDLAASVRSGAILAAVRSATSGMPVTETACAPFIAGSAMFSHNGVVLGWPDSVAPLADALPPAVLMTLEAPTDSAFLWALVRERLRAGHPAVKALAGVVADVRALAPGSRLNLLLLDGRHIAATTVGHSLWVRQAEGGVASGSVGKGGVTVSSEALDPDDESWQPVPDLCLLDATATQYSIQPLDQGWS